MVTKGYRKGVYERVTKGINGGYRWIGQTSPLYKRIAGWYKGVMRKGLQSGVAFQCG